MRHRVGQRKLGRVTEHRIAMLRNQAEALIRHERLETTMPKAKELRPFVERIITIAKRGLAGGDANGKSLHARRLVLRDIQNRDVVSKLFDSIAPRYRERPGGYTRLLRLGYRRGDSAEVAAVELLGSEYDPNQAEEKSGAAAEKPKKKTMGGRIREAFGGGKKADQDQASKTKSKASRPAKGAAKKVTTPRKAGGS